MTGVGLRKELDLQRILRPRLRVNTLVKQPDLIWKVQKKKFPPSCTLLDPKRSKRSYKLLVLLDKPSSITQDRSTKTFLFSVPRDRLTPCRSDTAPRVLSKKSVILDTGSRRDDSTRRGMDHSPKLRMSPRSERIYNSVFSVLPTKVFPSVGTNDRVTGGESPLSGE